MDLLRSTTVALKRWGTRLAEEALARDRPGCLIWNGAKKGLCCVWRVVGHREWLAQAAEEPISRRGWRGRPCTLGGVPRGDGLGEVGLGTMADAGCWCWDQLNMRASSRSDGRRPRPVATLANARARRSVRKARIVSGAFSGVTREQPGSAATGRSQPMSTRSPRHRRRRQRPPRGSGRGRR